MASAKCYVSDGQTIVAKDLDLDIAMVLVEGYFARYRDGNLQLRIGRMYSEDGR